MPDKASSCSVVLWDVGGTLVDRVLSPEDTLRRSLAAIGMRPEELGSGRALQALQKSIQSAVKPQPQPDPRRLLEGVALSRSEAEVPPAPITLKRSTSRLEEIRVS